MEPGAVYQDMVFSISGNSRFDSRFWQKKILRVCTLEIWVCTLEIWMILDAKFHKPKLDALATF